MLRRGLCYLATLATLAMSPPSVPASNASYQSNSDEGLIREARETHRNARAKALAEYQKDIEKSRREIELKLRNADFAYYHRLRMASDSFHRSNSNGEDEDITFQSYTFLTHAADIEHALQMSKVNATFDLSSQEHNRSLENKFSEADRRLDDVFRKVED